MVAFVGTTVGPSGAQGPAGQDAVPGHAEATSSRVPDPITPRLVPQTDLGDATGVTELRVHGVGGTSPADMLGDLTPVQVAGNRLAGFYRAPDPRPDRHVEAYSWGGLTSRSRLRALWVFLLPFMLANLAGWTSSPRDTFDETKGPVHGFRLAAAKLAALAMTLSILMTTAMLVMDVVAYQCGAQPQCAGSATWLSPLTWGDLPQSPARRLVLGAAAMVAILTVFAILSFTSRQRYEAIEPPMEMQRATASRTPSGTSACDLPGGLAHREFWCGRAPHTRLTRAHLAGGVVVVAVTLALATANLLGGMDDPAANTLRTVGLAACAVSFAFALVTVLWETAPLTGRPHPWPSLAALGAALVGLVVVAVAAWRQPDPPRPVAGQTPGITLAFNLTWVAIGLLLVPVAAASLRDWRRMWARDPSRERDGIGWISPLSAVGLGIMLAQAVLLSMLIWVGTLLSGGQPVLFENLVRLDVSESARQPMVLPPMVASVTAYFVWLGVLFLVVFVVVAVARYLRAGAPAAMGAPGTSDAEVDYAGERAQFGSGGQRPRSGRDAWVYSATVADADDLATRWGRRDGRSEWTRGVARWQFLARASNYVSSFVNTIVLVAVLLAVLLWALVYLFGVDGPSLAPEVAVGPAVAIALLLPPAMFAFVVLTWRNLSQRRVIGTLWDVGTFWPRSFHPFAPPCYAERAVPELTRRVWWLNDNGGEVVVAAHSQGTVIAAATALRHDLEVNDRPRFALVTYGSPLRKLYGRAFPAYWSREAIDSVLDPATSLVHQGRWANVYYYTDYIGGTVMVPGVDRRLPDPPSSVYVYGQHPPSVLSHTGYSRDPRFRGFVEEMVEVVAADRATARVATTDGTSTPTNMA